jgi:hypothetical protein
MQEETWQACKGYAPHLHWQLFLGSVQLTAMNFPIIYIYLYHLYNNNYKKYLEYIPFHFKSLADQVRHWQICEMLH